MFWFTADEHFGHSKIIELARRPFNSVEEMDRLLIESFNEFVQKDDVTVHAGDFSFYKRAETDAIIKRLNGNHIFLYGSHDAWMRRSERRYIWSKKIEGQRIIACHYAMRTWPEVHKGAWHVFGHSHGALAAYGKSCDVGVDANTFCPVSLEALAICMNRQPETPDDGRGKS